jgi:long-chain acyl-CoA synthetase
VSWKDGAVTYGQLAEDAARMRGFLNGLGLDAGSHIGIWMKNSYDFIKAFLAVATAGHVAVLFPPALPPEALREELGKMDVCCLITGPDAADAVPGAEAVKTYRVTQCDLDAAAEPDGAITGETPAAIIFSGGTTGRSKGALLSHRALMQGAWYGCFSPQKIFGIRYLLALPLTHVFGLVRCLLTPFMTGCSIYISGNMQDIITDIRLVKPHIMILVPGLAGLLLQFASKYGAEVLGGSLEVIICGGAPVRPGIVLGLWKFGVNVCPGYGLTETASLVSGNGNGQDFPDSVGVPYMEQELKLVQGELWVKGPHVMTEYYNDPAATALAMEDGWLKTGDLARLGEDGFLYITGRLKNLIVTETGKKVSPEELEALLNAHGSVRESLVYAEKNALGKSLLTAEILPPDALMDEGEAAYQAIVDQINRALEPHKQIKRVIVRREDFKRSPSMKIIRP